MLHQSCADAHCSASGLVSPIPLPLIIAPLRSRSAPRSSLLRHVPAPFSLRSAPAHSTRSRPELPLRSALLLIGSSPFHTAVCSSGHCPVPARSVNAPFRYVPLRSCSSSLPSGLLPLRYRSRSAPTRSAPSLAPVPLPRPAPVRSAPAPPFLSRSVLLWKWTATFGCLHGAHAPGGGKEAHRRTELCNR